MSNITVETIPSNMEVSVIDGNNVSVNVQNANEIILQVTPTPLQTIQIDRGVQGPQGEQGVQGIQGIQGIQGEQGVPGNEGIYGSFYDTTTQTIGSITSAYFIKLNTTDDATGISIANDGSGNPTKILFANQGTYSITFSIQFANTHNQIVDTDVWLVKNGSIIPDSNSKFAIPNSHGGNEGHLIGTLNFMPKLNAGDYLQIAWSADNVNASIKYIAQQSNPTRPATPSIILTAFQYTYDQAA